jgi:hypothetical protein
MQVRVFIKHHLNITPFDCEKTKVNDFFKRFKRLQLRVNVYLIYFEKNPIVANIQGHWELIINYHPQGKSEMQC